MADWYDYGTEERKGGPSGFWQGLHPGVRSAVLLWLILLGIAILNTVTGGSSIVFCYPVQVLLYLANGALAGYFALNAGYEVSDLPRIGAIAGFVLWILPALFYLVFGLILGIVTLGVGFLGVASWILCGPVELAVQAACGALGAWLYGRFA
ncbi:MAG: hypothetical protein ACP5UM_06590 [Anaerolineae bacterium]